MDISTKIQESSLTQEIKDEITILFSNVNLTYEQKIDFLNLLENIKDNKHSCKCDGECSEDSCCGCGC